MGLGDKISRPSRHLSGGEQQRVAIARALANDPQVILADEPTGNLDTANSNRVFSLLTDLVRRQDKALLLVTHNSAIAEACDWVHTMKDGMIVGPASEPAHVTFQITSANVCFTRMNMVYASITNTSPDTDTHPYQGQSIGRPPTARLRLCSQKNATGLSRT